jgi:hypothetical protein
MVDGMSFIAKSFRNVLDDLGCFRPYDGRVLVASSRYGKLSMRSRQRR